MEKGSYFLRLPLLLIMALVAAVFADAAIPKGRNTTKKRTAQKQAVAPLPEVDFTALNTLLPIYLKAHDRRQDITSPLTAIVSDYLRLTAAQKERYRREVIGRASMYFDEGLYRYSQPLLDLYDAFHFEKEEAYALEAACFYRGAMAVIIQGDTVSLKKEICNLESMAVTDDPRLRERRIGVLKDYLQQMRDYIPAHNMVEGVWLANLSGCYDGFPSFIIDVTNPSDPHKGKAVFKLREGFALEHGSFDPFLDNPYAHMSNELKRMAKNTDGSAESLSKLLMSKSTAELESIVRPTSFPSYNYGGVFKNESLRAQEVLSFGNDSIYCVWSSESLRNPSPELNELFRGTGLALSSGVNTGFIATGGGDFASSLAGGIMGGLIDMGVNALADAIFTPSKKSLLIQMKAKRINDREMEADIYFSGLKVKGDALESKTNHVYHTVLTRVEPSDSLFFVRYSRVTPVIETQNFDMKEVMNARQWENKFGSTSLTGENPTDNIYFNRHQFMRQLHNSNIRSMSVSEPNRSATVLTILDRTKSKLGIGPNEKAFKDGTLVGIWLEDDGFKGKKNLPGFKKGDYLTYVQGIKVKTFDEVRRILDKFDEGESLEVSVLRGKNKAEVFALPKEQLAECVDAFDLPGVNVAPEKGFPAYLAGIQKGDRVISIAGNTMKSIYDIIDFTMQLEPYNPVEITVLRKGNPKTFTVTPVLDYDYYKETQSE